MDSDFAPFTPEWSVRMMRELIGVSRRTRADRDKRAAQKRTSAREQRAKMKRHQRTSRKGRGKGR